MITVAGLAILKFPDGKMTGRISAAQTPFLLMINNQFNGGSLEVPCPAGKPCYDSVRLLKVRSKVNPILQGESVQLDIQTDVEGGIAELACSEIVSDEDFKAFSQRLSEIIETRIRETVRHLQQERADLIGIGNKLSRTSLKLWADWQQSWSDQFAAMDVQVQVHLKITNTGMQVSVPFSQGK
ncbi:Ger(x)C family spore germination C-terminal domain-containing protein [Paenibacillus sp. y28]|uniref:Ger(x)C family spore germination C-terminal domain-containing protein n=1 Tax=Paenibacillus sp. y28 TaxID=3129110 RepID=UPI003015A042